MRRITLIIGALLLFPLHSATALGLGELDVKSVMNQRLDAQIGLVSVKTGDIINMTVRLAEPEVFKSAGLPRPYYLTKLRFEPVETAENAGHIRVTTKERIREPYLSFIIEVTWPNGRLLREYTVLLDTP
jgi:pilus assembly protein FimV